mmetsp:Transcript_55412/g.134569  ORF Transcript_55412/g.134569 Transcript_55412/m.134569 type:complete len:175 (-) Transcript_55412:444-968(-)
MVKNWADHCSSDEESIGDDAPPHEQFDEQLQISPHDHEHHDSSNPDVTMDAGAGAGAGLSAKPPKTYDYPSQPPFTAFVGNLSYNIKTNEDFVAAMDDECRRRLSSSSQQRQEERVKFLGGRIAFSRDGGNHRGFGYLEVETLDQVLEFFFPLRFSFFVVRVRVCACVCVCVCV